jgi:hypothetical protein
MASFTHVFSAEEIEYLLQHPEVVAAREKLCGSSSGTLYFSIEVTATIRQTLDEKLGIDLSNISRIPLRWIVGDTAPHVDVGPAHFENTYLVYVNDSAGEFILDTTAHPIAANTAYVFNEGIQHETTNTGATPRLLVGPMNKLAQPVGIPPINYFPSEADALAQTNGYGYSVTFTIGSPGSGEPFGGYTHWRIASNSTGSSSQTQVYANGTVLNSDGYYFMYPGTPCFLEGTTILCLVDGAEKYVAVEILKKGDLVKTSLDGYKPVVLIGNGSILNPGNDERTEDRLYKCSPAKYPELTHDLFITGCHSILIPALTPEQRAATIKHLGKVYATDKKHRLIACIDERAEPWNSEGRYPIWHFALEHTDEHMNYGVYANGGLLVETCSISFLKTKSNMTVA